MKVFLNISLFIITSFAGFAQEKEPEFLWKVQTSGEAADRDIAVDKEGNSYVYGVGYLKTDFGNNVVLEGAGNIYFIVKYDKNGIAQWAKEIETPLTTSGEQITVDTFGNIYIINSIWFSKYDAQCNLLWKHSLYDANLSSLTTDDNGNSYICGAIIEKGTVDFGNQVALTANKLSFFIAKYNADGQCQWAKTNDNAEHRSVSQDIAISSRGDIFLCGGFENRVNLGSNLSLDSSGGFIAKYNSDGTILWAKKTAFDSISTGAPIKFSLDGKDNVYAFGYASTKDFWVGKYTQEGDNVWGNLILKKESLNTDFQAYDIVVDSLGKSTVCGTFGATNQIVTLPLGNNISITNDGNANAFIVQYDTNGTTLSAATVGGLFTITRSMDIDKEGNAYICGERQHEDTFDMVLFIAKYGINTTVSVENTEFLKTNNILSIHPNPAHSTSRISFTTTAPSHTRLTLTDVLGRQTLLKEETLDAAEHSAEINTANFPAGIYVLTLEAAGQVASQTVVIER